MKRFMVIISVMFLSLVIGGIQTFSQTQTQPVNKASNEQSENVKSMYTCPMHPELTSAKPGTCPKCGMNLVKKQMDKEKSNNESNVETPKHSITPHEEKTGAMMIDDVRKSLQKAKTKLAEEGKYGCCIKEPCNLCALAHSNCDCYYDLKKGEHVCIECYAGWQQGNGADKTIKKENVKTSTIHHEHNH